MQVGENEINGIAKGSTMVQSSQQISANTQGPPPDFGHNFAKQEEIKPAWVEGLLKKTEDIDVKAEIKTTN